MHTSSQYELDTVDTKQALEAMMIPAGGSNTQGQKRKREDDEESDEDQAHDEVRLWEAGFKDRYYESKFDVSADNLEFRYCRILTRINNG